MRLIRAAAFALGLAVCAGAAAHETKLSSSRVELAGRAANVLVEVNGADLQAALGTELLGADRNLADAAPEAAADRIEEYLGARVRLGAAGVSCPLEAVRLEPAAEHLRAWLRFRCPPPGGTLRYEVTLFHEIDPRARHMVTVSGDARRFGLLSVAAPGMDLGRVEASPWEVAGHYLAAGVEHIAIGYDHIAFLVAAIVWGRRLWPLAKLVTAFTLAHSVTLSLAALDVLRPPGAWVEVAIAASIVYMATENFFVRSVRHRWPVTFVFGLVHGFGFAGVLKEYGVPREALVPALASFNVGVELGQLVIVTAVLALLHAIDRVQRSCGVRELPDRRVAYAISSVVLASGIVWLVQRLPEALAGA